ncbi:conserved hypothetical protein [Methylocella silvestris BL2]|uniref:Ribonuclease R winged-helix domain-containing protein n=1 Tax=Methylocella silvestris (strain DSM 15510 / CIP 108128 / LMG 27833 / NCIMB 13906 / BL2) TaxID=395965 RepID=B8EKF1_METSB|nr:winged-helix domain-containing protein [Methylocella silvestris]ACK50691.1 conserved hypothetical protein [Methylocella silvestris BL2]
MDTSLERIRSKIVELEQKIADLRIAERELHALEGAPAAKPRGRAAAAPVAAAPASAPPASPAKTPVAKTRVAKASVGKRGPRKASAEGAPRQTIGAAISEVLDKHGALPAAEISEQIKATGRDINNRMVSFALQAMKKRGLVKNSDGKWSTAKPRSK